MSEYFASLLSFLQQYWKYLLILGVFCLIALIVGIFRKKQMKAAGDAFLAEHPDAAKVFCGGRSAITAESVQVLSVNGGPPSFTVKGSSILVFLLPGDSTLEARYTYQRPGVMYKTVTKTYDGTVTVTAEACKAYILGYDRKADQFTFTETAE
ncbi:MAG: hypothetical protein LBJ11_05090 [Oscillospiraceae bacterium]|jgi:hypothetical protein|nr:hypothetical protein [Oscillospiraceae bacterium]